jgi:hypothetical protein
MEIALMLAVFFVIPIAIAEALLFGARRKWMPRSSTGYITLAAIVRALAYMPSGFAYGHGAAFAPIAVVLLIALSTDAIIAWGLTAMSFGIGVVVFGAASVGRQWFVAARNRVPDSEA